jgi:phage FluMu gp28-like protein
LWLSTFFAFQVRWLLDWSRFSLISKARQIGASHTMAAAAVLWSLMRDTTTVISIGEREAIEVLDKVNRHAIALARFGSRWAIPTSKATEVRLASGGRIIALPSTSGGRSYSGNVILDEAAYHQHPEKVWDGAGGTVLHGYKLRVMSTPNGVGNLWHALWSDPKAHAGYSRHEVTINDARADGMAIDEAEAWRMARGDERVFNQLFRCSFLDGDQQYIPSLLVERAIVDNAYLYEGDAFGGLDIGRTADITALVVVKRDAAGVFWEQAVYECKRTSQADIDAMVETAFREHDLTRLCVDSTGIGAFPAENLQNRYGRFKVEPVVFTPASKEEMATTLYQVFADKRIRLARLSQALRDDVCKIRRIITAAGNVRYDAPQTDQGHADRAWALALALHAGTDPSRRKHDLTYE